MTEGGRTGGGADHPVVSFVPLRRLEQQAGDPVAVGVIDTGVVALDDQPHPFIASNLAESWPSHLDRLPDAGEPRHEYDGHGTFVAGLILKQAPTATIHMRNALDTSSPDDPYNDALVAEHITSLIAVPDLKVVNLSFYGASDDTAPEVIGQALEKLFYRHTDLLVVTAVGNRWDDRPTWPAAFNTSFPGRVIAVGAVDESVTPVPGLLPPKASFCSLWAGIDAYASGVRVVGPGLTDGSPGYAFGAVRWSGNSFAAATVTGLLARAISGGATGQEARAYVLQGAPVPVPGLPEGRWKPYVRAPDSVWPH
jgi:hypothetical protein